MGLHEILCPDSGSRKQSGHGGNHASDGNLYGNPTFASLLLWRTTLAETKRNYKECTDPDHRSWHCAYDFYLSWTLTPADYPPYRARPSQAADLGIPAKPEDASPPG